MIDDLVGTPVLVADTQQAERELEAIPWVEDAKVTTHFPHGVSIEIRERAPVATYQGPDMQVPGARPRRTRARRARPAIRSRTS